MTLAADALGPESLIGEVFGDYRLERIIGSGATGAVYLGNRLSGAADGAADDLPQHATIKVLEVPWRLDQQERDAFKTRFSREAEILRRLHHPHIVPIIAFGEQSGRPYIVLPFLSGGTLAQRLSSALHGLPLNEVANYVSEIADALDYAHAQGVVHRDIKPSNILFDDTGSAYLSDFGIAEVLESASTTVTETGLVVGTPMYMSPEQSRGDVLDRHLTSTAWESSCTRWRPANRHFNQRRSWS
jgi:serine/threonine protein kinase